MIPLQAWCGAKGVLKYSSTLPCPRHKKLVIGQQHAPAALYPRERPGIHFTEGCVVPRAGLEGLKISSQLGFDPRPRQSLYRLSYPAHEEVIIILLNIRCRFDELIAHHR
jgi:hypothetical protein